MIELKFLSKTSKSKECNICHYWYFLDKRFKREQNASNGCNDFSMTSMNLRNVAILNVKSADYCCIISGIS